MKRLNGFSGVLSGFERFWIASEKFSVYFSEVYNPTPPPNPMTPPQHECVGGWGFELLRRRPRTSQKLLKTFQNFWEHLRTSDNPFSLFILLRGSVCYWSRAKILESGSDSLIHVSWFGSQVQNVTAFLINGITPCPLLPDSKSEIERFWRKEMVDMVVSKMGFSVGSREV
jgi:hypothetical protein